MLSALQRAILAECANRRGEVSRRAFEQYLEGGKGKPEHRARILSRSLERLIERGFLVGYGIRTPQKWFIQQVKITQLGRRQWKAWLGSRQTRFSLRSV